MVRLLPDGVKINDNSIRLMTMPPIDICPLLKWMMEETQKAIAMLREGTYMDYVRANISPECKCGQIDCKTYWSFVPEAKIQKFGQIDPESERMFLTWVDLHSEDEVGVDRFTSGDYFRACKEYYEVTGKLKESDMGKTPKELYQKYSDGRDGGLCELNEESAEEFDRWLTEGHYEHHVWELDYAHIWLQVDKDNGKYYLKLYYHGDSKAFTEIKVVIALVKRGLPISAHFYKNLAKKLKGVGFIAVVAEVANYDNWIPLEKRRIRDPQLIDSVVLPRPAPDGLVESIDWSDIPDVRLKNND